MSKYKLAIFDVDGTLLDTSEGIISSVKYTMEQVGLEKPSEDVYKSFIGPPIQVSFQKLYKLDETMVQEIATIFRNQYSMKDLLKAKPYDGIYSCLETLIDNEINIAIATYKREDYAKELLKEYGFDKYTEIIYGGDHYNKLSKSDIIGKCISDSNIEELSEIVMIGDTSNDAIGAEKIGIDFIGVSFGFGFSSPDERINTRAIGFADSPEEIVDLIIGK